MEYKASKFIKWVYCLTLAAKIFITGSRSAEWVFVTATGNGSLAYFSLIVLLICLVLLYRLYLVVRFDGKLDAYLSGEIVKVFRGLGVALMIVGLTTTILAMVVHRIAMKSPGLGGALLYDRGTYMELVGALAWLGIILFEWSRYHGSKRRPHGSQKDRDVNTIVAAVPADGRNVNPYISKKTTMKLIIVAGCLIGLFLYVFDPYVTWREEVKLSDGRIIVVEQKKRDVGDMDREAWLTINLPEFSSQPIVWHENLRPIIVNIDSGRLYVVGYPPTGIEERHYGNPSPLYVGFVWQNGTWNRIPFGEIPEKIYMTNLLIRRFPPKGIFFLSMEKKNGIQLNGDPTTPPFLKRIDPKATPD